MSEAGFTKGPWQWVGNNYIDGPNGETVLECGDDGKDWGLHSAVLRVSDDDRALIAAAPDLFEALIEMEREKSDYMTRNKLGNPAEEHTNKMARAAIAKALGRI